MNTVGKILVILNFLFAVVVGALLVVDVAARNNWKEKYHELAREFKVLQDGRNANVKVQGSITSDYVTLQSELKDSNQKLEDSRIAAKAVEDNYIAQVDELNRKMGSKDATVLQAKQALDRVVSENSLLNATIKEREVSIVTLEGKVNIFRLTAQNFEAMARTRQIQNENLLERLREVELALVKERAGVTPDRVTVLKPNEPNPPAIKIDGKVEKVQGMLVQLSVGTDHGLKENNTLDVYRLRPDPVYLGMIRITDARAHVSVGRLIPANNAAKNQLREGDLVTSKFK